ncbi:hypothetical protein EU555_16490 [Methylobacterium nonmethylotrophicum]|uniref:Uncharacterized protein n=1 Tax=Methylobacterium nonmethylotrophicum TaxID=1141884 RepID=A0A4Z0NNN5_9HYPH|nr:hypothetical protein EU555_16490 [Methylobacterium nonmethylotrophicum]
MFSLKKRFDACLGPSHRRPHPEVLGDRRSLSLEGGFQNSLRSLEASFEAATRHLRMRSWVGQTKNC